MKPQASRPRHHTSEAATVKLRGPRWFPGATSPASLPNCSMNSLVLGPFDKKWRRDWQPQRHPAVKLFLNPFLSTDTLELLIPLPKETKVFHEEILAEWTLSLEVAPARVKTVVRGAEQPKLGKRVRSSMELLLKFQFQINNGSFSEQVCPQRLHGIHF